MGVGQWLYVASPLLWLPQAGLLALAVARLQSGHGMAGLWGPALGVALVGAVRAWMQTRGQQLLFDQARRRLSAWRKQTVATLAGRSPLDRHRPHAGQAASVIAEQAQAILLWHTRYRGALWRVRVVPAILLVAVFYQSWLAALILAAAAPMIPIFMALVGWRARAASQQQWEQLGGMHAFLLDRLRGLPTLRALEAVAHTAKRLRRSNERLRRRTMRVLRIAFLSSAVLELFSALGVAMVAAYTGFHLLGVLSFGSWGQSLSLGQALFILLLAPAFFDPLRELASAWHDRAEGQAAKDALQAMNQGGLALPSAQTAGQQHLSASPAVQFKGVTVDLDDGHTGTAPALQHFDLQIKPGEHVALMGASGAGKTLVLSALAGLMPVAAGQISVDGIVLSADTAAGLRRNMAWMGQSPHIFQGSVQHNVTLGRAVPDVQDVAWAIDMAGLSRVAQAHPGTSLGEGGVGLSGGEAARLALARFALPRAGLLLLDEPTAHLDANTAAHVIESICKLARGRTLIVATHDALLAERMDRVVMLDRPDDAAHKRVA